MAFQDDQPLAGWQDTFGDVWGYVQKGADIISRAGGSAQRVGTQVQNAGGNLQNLTSWRIDGKTVVVGALLAGALIYATRRR